MNWAYLLPQNQLFYFFHFKRLFLFGMLSIKTNLKHFLVLKQHPSLKKLKKEFLKFEKRKFMFENSITVFKKPKK